MTSINATIPFQYTVYIYSMRFMAAMKQFLKPVLWIYSVLLGALKYLFTPMLWKRITLIEAICLNKRNWYHDFTSLGIKTKQFDDPSYKLSQEQKDGIILNWIDKYIRINESTPFMKGVDLFCADAYYSFHAINAGVGKMLALDLAEDSGEQRSGILKQAEIIQKILTIPEDKLDIRKYDIMRFNEKCDFAFVFGGLYHVENPLKLLSNLRTSMCQLIFIQTIVSLENESVDYFESPAPGWNWGSRFSASWLIRNLELLDYRIVESKLEIANYNFALRDRGSLFLVCQPVSSDTV